MVTLRSLFTWSLMIVATGLFAGVAALLVVLSLGRLRSRAIAWMQPLWARLALWASGTTLELSGQDIVAERRPRVLVLNHASVFDLVVVAALNPPAPCPVFKAELRWIPPMNLALWAIGGIFVDRGRSIRAMGSLEQAAGRVRAEARTVFIAPEGTRSRDGRLARFKRGAFRLAHLADAEIVPLVIHNAGAVCPPTGWRIYGGTIRAEVKPPLAPGGDARMAADALRARYLEWLA